MFAMIARELPDRKRNEIVTPAVSETGMGTSRFSTPPVR
jgi:hypothetical protein